MTKILFPVIVEKDEDGFYVVECPILQGCYTQGKTLDSALKNIHEVIEICLEETKNQIFSFHTVAVEIWLPVPVISGRKISPKPTPTPEETKTETKTETEKQKSTSGFEYGFAIIGLLIIYLLKKIGN